MKKLLLVVSTVALIALTAGAALAEYSPTLEFGLSDTKVNGNPEISIRVEQDDEEEELGHVTLTIPKGFNLPADEDIENGEALGAADLEIAAGPECRPDGASSIPLSPVIPIPNREIFEQDRTDEQVDEGVVAVWVVDLRPVTSIPLEVTGSIKKGWRLDGDIPANDNTCPPLVFDGVINAQSEGGVPILTNPKKPGIYVFGGQLFSQTSPDVYTHKQPIKITK